MNEKFHLWPHVTSCNKHSGTLKILLKLPLGHVYKVYRKDKWISCLCLAPFSKILHYVYANTLPRPTKNLPTWNLKYFCSQGFLVGILTYI
jgi:hypothetical protein